MASALNELLKPKIVDVQAVNQRTAKITIEPMTPGGRDVLASVSPFQCNGTFCQ